MTHSGNTVPKKLLTLSWARSRALFLCVESIPAKWSKSQNYVLRHQFRKYWLWSCVNVAWRGVRRAANQFSRLPSTEAICLTLERKNPVPGQDTRVWTQSQRFDIQARHPATPTLKVHLTLLKLVCLFLSSCLSLSHKHTPVHTYAQRWLPQGLKVAMDLKSHYVKALLCVTTGYICTF